MYIRPSGVSGILERVLAISARIVTASALKSRLQIPQIRLNKPQRIAHALGNSSCRQAAVF
jgi:hypothetical protein